MTELPTSLPACATNHPAEPSMIMRQHIKTVTGKVFDRCVCCTCRSVKALAQPRVGKRFVEREKLHGVVCLNWTPPERLLTTTQSSSVGFGTLLLLRRMREQLERVAA